MTKPSLIENYDAFCEAVEGQSQVTPPAEAPSSPQEAPEDEWLSAFKKLPRKARRALLGAAKRDTRRKQRADLRELRMARREAGVAPWRIEKEEEMG